MVPAWAQDKPLIRMAAVFSDKDIRAEMFNMIIKDNSADFSSSPTTWEACSNRAPSWSRSSATTSRSATSHHRTSRKQMVGMVHPDVGLYLFRDANHVLAFFASDVGAQMKKEAEDQLKIKILGPTFFGTRQVGIKPKKKINTPADMAGIKLRMPPGDAWQLLGRSLGANPTPVAFAETYTALQTGTVDGQDNPLPNVNAVKFYEVLTQIVLTSHLIAFDVLSMNLKTWNGMSPARQTAFQASVDKALAWSVQEHLKKEVELADSFKKMGLEIYTPDINAFRAYAQKVYLASDEAKSWAPGILDKIAAVK